MLRSLVAAALAALGAAAWLVATSGPDVAAQVSPPPAGRPAQAAPAPRRPAAAPALSFKDAARELDLILPARPKAAEDFTLPLVDGRTFRLASQRGKPVFVNFWATWCPPCLEEMPAMERLWREHRDRLVMVAISVDSDPKAVAPFVERHGLTFAIALDPGLGVANAYGVRALPATVLVDREGMLKALALGPREWDGNAARAVMDVLTRP